MAFVHGKDTVILLGATDLSAFANTSELTRSADTHDVTTYGKDDHVYSGGLGDGTATMAGIYDNGATGPRATIEPLIGTEVVLTRRPEGTGSGLPQDIVDVIINSYVETNAVADMVMWSCEMQLSDAVNSADQI
ncbi:MAG: hypothetical protein ACRDT6_09480 [Micromonosporaceae bacterium]